MKTKAPEIKPSWLVQRLDKPRQSSLGWKTMDNPFSFGGGLRNGGLSPEAMDLVRPVFSFHYMGAAEYEFGEVPAALRKMVQHAQGGYLDTFTVTVPFKKIPRPWRAPTSLEMPEGDAVVYVIAPKQWKKDVTSRVKAWAQAKDHGSRRSNPYAIRDATNLCRALFPFDEWDSDVQGWLELNNGFMFFADEEMFTATARLFGLLEEDEGDEEE